MAHNPQAPYGQGQAPQGQNPQGYDPAGNTQMFRAFVDEGAPQQQPQAVASSGGPRVGLIVGVIAAIVVLAVAAWLALS
ncbi:hypothetical protein [Streptomyces sp. NPDC058664]|uniref:hypothetical protein n=1 Tax=unclassified Streptomyces TaxID=2593676 RepID=UPI00364E6D64